MSQHCNYQTNAHNSKPPQKKGHELTLASSSTPHWLPTASERLKRSAQGLAAKAGTNWGTTNSAIAVEGHTPVVVWELSWWMSGMFFIDPSERQGSQGLRFFNKNQSELCSSLAI